MYGYRVKQPKPNTWNPHIERKTLDENIHAIEFIPKRIVKEEKKQQPFTEKLSTEKVTQ